MRAGNKEDARYLLSNYCVPGYSVGPSDGDRIDGIVFGNIVSLTALPENYLGYTDHSYEAAELITAVDRDATYSMGILVGPYDPPNGAFEQYKVWIDFDQDGEFGAFEEVLNVQTTAAFQDFNADIFIPADARPGYTGMRIRCVYNDANFDACSQQSYGEAEDYTILINGNAPCIPFTTNGTWDGDFIGGVEMSGLLYTQTSQPDHAYTSNLANGAQLRPSDNGTFTITSGAFANDYFGAWADWNMDGDFDDPDEALGTVLISGAFTPATLNYSVPADARVGYTLLRVRAVFNDPAMTPCSFSQYGETQDFTLSVIDGIYPCLPATEGTLLGDGFTTVTFNGTTYNGTTAWPFYTLATEPHHVQQGDQVPVDIIAATYIPQTYAVWLDITDNGDFSDPGESLGSIQAASAYEALSIIATIPATCPPGQHMLRVSGYDTNNGEGGGCGDLGYGEVLDIPLVVEDPMGSCIPHMSVWTRDGDYIDGVELEELSNTSSGGAYLAAYTDYTTLTGTVNLGQSHALHITSGDYTGDTYYAWIDWNADGDWDDLSELIGSVAIPAAHTTATITFNTPAVTMGTKRMRIRCSYDPLTSACQDGGFGETEDYTVMVSTSTGVTSVDADLLSVVPLRSAGILELRSALIGAWYRVLDSRGMLVKQGQVTSTIEQLPLGEIAPGAYTLQLHSETTVQMRRFIW